MFAFFDTLGAIFSTIVNFVIGVIEMVLHLIGIIVKGTLFLFALLPNMPAFCMTFLAVTIALAILIQLLNKGA